MGRVAIVSFVVVVACGTPAPRRDPAPGQTEGPGGPPAPVAAGREAEPAGCPAGTCRRHPDGPCEAPTGQVGNACCRCGDDGMCADFCRCAALETPIETPDGARPIGSLAPGDLVISLDRGRRRAVPILEVRRAPALDHHVVHLVLATGAHLRMSPGHPTADGRSFAELRAGDRLDDVEIVSAAVEPYELAETADILPASDTGTYVASGVLVGSTLFGGVPARARR